MAVSSGEILCRRCAAQELPEPELLRYLDEYVSSLPQAMRASDETYARRLAACAVCQHRTHYTCTLCGCYVQARAAKRAMACPLPGTPRWEREL
ncbi:MAG TPA: hypothetical protein IAA84_11250 [Candidatus Alectryocaccomicrobium excrementavium]|uniref:Uncharacterized protein n=1 Tax=Candidatus Alectryocaccomicrobium excrementavium TaxID=2840668 RepID=A0A9D1K6I4_9FIRM|nr:hypothetical protein [Candidatus Alectryocaccomicrobium excrementavium]